MNEKRFEQTPIPAPETVGSQAPAQGEREPAPTRRPYITMPIGCELPLESDSKWPHWGAKSCHPIITPITRHPWIEEPHHGQNLPQSGEENIYSEQRTQKIIAYTGMLNEEEAAEYKAPTLPPRERILVESILNARFAVKRVLNDPVALALMKRVLEGGVPE